MKIIDIRSALSKLKLTEHLRTDSMGRQDSQTLPFFERQLEQILSKTYDREFPELMAAMGEVVPIDTEVDEGAETFTYYMYEPTGVAKFLDSYASDDLPMVSIRGAKVTGNVEPMANGYFWTTRDVRNAAFANRPLESDLARAARRAHDQLLHYTILWGREDIGLPGFVNHPNINVADAPAAAGGGSNPTFWENKTAVEVFNDIATAIDGVDEITNKVHRVTRCLIANPQYNYINRTRTGELGDSTTILEWCQKTWPGVQFLPIVDLEASKSQGNLSTNAMIAYQFDAEMASAVVPMPFRQYPVQEDGLKFVVPCESSTGGVKMPYPLAVYRVDGIGNT